MEALPGQTGRASWRELVAHRDERFAFRVRSLQKLPGPGGEEKRPLPDQGNPLGEKDGYYLEYPDRAYLAMPTPTPEARHGSSSLHVHLDDDSLDHL